MYRMRNVIDSLLYTIPNQSAIFAFHFFNNQLIWRMIHYY